jgi:hypothetical protein
MEQSEEAPSPGARRELSDFLKAATIVIGSTQNKSEVSANFWEL